MARLSALLLCLAAGAAQAQSCVDSVTDAASLEECARAEILPLETRVVHLVNTVRSKHRNDPAYLRTFEQAHDAWNAYRNGQCTAESADGGKRAFARCARRTLELRVKELEGL